MVFKSLPKRKRTKAIIGMRAPFNLSTDFFATELCSLHQMPLQAAKGFAATLANAKGKTKTRKLTKYSTAKMNSAKKSPHLKSSWSNPAM